MAQWLRTLIALAEDPNFLPRTHTGSLMRCNKSSPRGSNALFRPLQGLIMQVMHDMLQAKYRTH